MMWINITSHKLMQLILYIGLTLSYLNCFLIVYLVHLHLVSSTLRLRQNGRHFPDDIFKWIFWNEDVWISIEIWLKFVSKGPINNIPALVQIMAWRRPGDKPLSEPMMSSLLCVTQPQWVKTYKMLIWSSGCQERPKIASNIETKRSSESVPWSGPITLS